MIKKYFLLLLGIASSLHATHAEGDTLGIVPFSQDRRFLEKDSHTTIMDSNVFGANTLLLALGTGGAITPGAAALLHNLVTLGAGAFSLTPLLPSPLPTMEENA